MKFLLLHFYIFIFSIYFWSFNLFFFWQNCWGNWSRSWFPSVFGIQGSWQPSVPGSDSQGRFATSPSNRRHNAHNHQRWEHWGLHLSCWYLCEYQSVLDAPPFRFMERSTSIWSWQIFTWGKRWNSTLCLLPILSRPSDLYWTNICSDRGSSVYGAAAAAVWVDTLSWSGWYETRRGFDPEAQRGCTLYSQTKTRKLKQTKETHVN